MILAFRMVVDDLSRDAGGSSTLVTLRSFGPDGKGSDIPIVTLRVADHAPTDLFCRGQVFTMTLVEVEGSDRPAWEGG